MCLRVQIYTQIYSIKFLCMNHGLQNRWKPTVNLSVYQNRRGAVSINHQFFFQNLFQIQKIEKQNHKNWKRW
jgi:hypothetical protein